MKSSQGEKEEEGEESANKSIYLFIYFFHFLELQKMPENDQTSYLKVHPFIESTPQLNFQK